MNSALKKVSTITRLPYRVIVYCPRCTRRRLINLKDYPGYTLNDMHLRMECSGCGTVGVDFSIVKTDI